MVGAAEEATTSRRRPTPEKTQPSASARALDADKSKAASEVAQFDKWCAAGQEEWCDLATTTTSQTSIGGAQRVSPSAEALRGFVSCMTATGIADAYSSFLTVGFTADKLGKATTVGATCVPPGKVWFLTDEQVNSIVGCKAHWQSTQSTDIAKDDAEANREIAASAAATNDCLIAAAQ